MRQLILILSTFLFLLSCETEVPREDLVEKPEEVNPHIEKILNKELEKFDTSRFLVIAKDTLLTTKYVVEFYKGKKFRPVWSDSGVFNADFLTLFRLISNARYYYGLVPADYHYRELDSLMRNTRDSATRLIDAVKLAHIDLLATDAFFVMANHLHHGRIKIDTVERLHWNPNKLKINMDSFLTVALDSHRIWQVLESLEPKYVQYIELKRALRKYIDEHKNDKWTPYPQSWKDTAEFLAFVKKRMIEGGYYDSTLNNSDSMKLVKALRKFQKANKLTEDGQVGKEMVRALKLQPEDMIRQIELNIERWRAESPSREKVYVWLNIPGFNMRVAEADTLVLDSRIICGDIKHHTPLLTSKIQNILVYPYWNVPYKIATEEILPRIKWDTAYLRKNRFDVLNHKNEVLDYTKINFKKYNKSNFPYRFRQAIGVDNSLGVMKFNFYNKWDVYIHDTNARKLFGRTVRAMSHGCMRLEKYFEFATFLIRDDSLHYKPDSLLAYIERQEQKKINLKKPVSLYVKYFTAEVVEGKLELYPDIYAKDEELKKLLYRD